MASTEDTTAIAVEDLPGPSNTTVRKNQYSKGQRPRHRPFPSKQQRANAPQPSRRGGAFYQKLKPTTSLLLTTRLPNFPVFCSNKGCKTLSAQVFNVMIARDYRLNANITVHMLQYVTCIAWLNRLAQLAIHFGYAFPPETSHLKMIAQSIMLPDVLAKYIETLGQVKLLSGVSVVPFAGTPDELFAHEHNMMISPFDLLERMGNPIPDNVWGLDPSVIVEYNNATARAERTGLRFRPVDNGAFEGKLEMLVSYRKQPGGALLPVAPQAMSESEAQIGACHMWRNYKHISSWLGTNRELLFDSHTAVPIIPEIVVSNFCVSSFNSSA